MNKISLKNRVMAALMHLLSLVLTFFLPLIVYLLVRKRSAYFTFHAKEGLNLHFTIFPLFFITTQLSKLWSTASMIAIGLLIIETILIVVATIFALRGKTFSYPVIRYFKTHEVSSFSGHTY